MHLRDVIWRMLSEMRTTFEKGALARAQHDERGYTDWMFKAVQNSADDPMALGRYVLFHMYWDFIYKNPSVRCSKDYKT